MTGKEELFYTLCETKLGEGASREVWSHRFNESLVVKVALDMKGIQNNFKEFDIYKAVINTDYQKHFAPVEWVSSRGHYLVMQRIKFKDKEHYPEKIPTFFYDTKYKNYGWLGKNFVACDYAPIDVLTSFSKKLKKAKWWGEDINGLR